MAFKLAEAFVEFSSRGQRSVNQSILGIRGSLGKVSNALRSPVGALLGIGGGISVLTGLRKVISDASNSQEVLSKFQAVFQEQTPAATTFVDSLIKSLGRSRSELSGFLASLQDTFVPLGFARDKALQMSETVTKLGIDLASFNPGVTEAEAINRLSSALVGNNEAVRAFGIVITEASLKAQLLKTGIEGGTRSATEQQKAMARLQIIMNSTKAAQGDAARTSDSFKNRVVKLNAKINELSGNLGTKLLPFAEEVVSFFTDITESANGAADAIGGVKVPKGPGKGPAGGGSKGLFSQVLGVAGKVGQAAKLNLNLISEAGAAVQAGALNLATGGARALGVRGDTLEAFQAFSDAANKTLSDTTKRVVASGKALAGFAPKTGTGAAGAAGAAAANDDLKNAADGAAGGLDDLKQRSAQVVEGLRSFDEQLQIDKAIRAENQRLNDLGGNFFRQLEDFAAGPGGLFRVPQEAQQLRTAAGLSSLLGANDLAAKRNTQANAIEAAARLLHQSQQQVQQFVTRPESLTGLASTIQNSINKSAQDKRKEALQKKANDLLGKMAEQGIKVTNIDQLKGPALVAAGGG